MTESHVHQVVAFQARPGDEISDLDFVISEVTRQGKTVEITDQRGQSLMLKADTVILVLREEL